MNRYSNVKDNTLRQPGASPGISTSRMCWGCSKRVGPLGGKLNPRTRMWSCAACVKDKK